jgi:hypothetical protein
MWTETEKQLPPEGKYVLGRHNRGTWVDSEDQGNVNCVVVKLKKGISKKDREKMKDGIIPDPVYTESWDYFKRSEVITSDDENGNNLRPYSFHAFGPDHFFGQSITHWQAIEPV